MTALFGSKMEPLAEPNENAVLEKNSMILLCPLHLVGFGIYGLRTRFAGPVKVSHIHLPECLSLRCRIVIHFSLT
jgi:hypothetical protein